nr:MAG TPA: hypothetical protein [Caudoviricetes sp.]
MSGRPSIGGKVSFCKFHCFSTVHFSFKMK